MAHSRFRLRWLGATLTQHLKRSVSVDSFTAGGLGKSGFNMRAQSLAVFDHPVLKGRLLANDFEGLVDDLGGRLVCARPDGQVDHALLFGFEVNYQGGPASTILAHEPC